MPTLNIQDFKYDLPSERIARYPLSNRDESKLLVYEHGQISHTEFCTIPDLLPKNSFLFFNDTKVIPARLKFQKDSGAEIEVFLLEPTAPSSLLAESMQATESCSWKCTIGNLKRWTEGTTLIKNSQEFILKANLINREQCIINFIWSNEKTFAEVVSEIGQTPLPPYLKRDADSSDRLRYQTIYSHHEGAVAAPTAGLHFTDQIFSQLKQRNIKHDFITLHVSAGTFQPIKVENPEHHTMHHEQIIVSRKNIANLLRNHEFIIPVGTTSLRTLESIFWFGVKLIENNEANFTIEQNFPYGQMNKIPTLKIALAAILKYMDKNNQDTLAGETSIFIKPGYTFRVAKGLITNFHQPASTLILLIAAFVGNDWKKIYEEALQNDYRFLSYGDSSLLIP
jgi:S-adenosylmethionine:tRNA ribosyltransferase-isomerase